MSDLITYEDKIRLKSQNVSDKYKVTAEDMNEIKKVVNAHADVIDEINKPENWVSVGVEEPTDGERVWFEKGKNLFNDSVERKNAFVNVNIGSTISYTSSSATYSFVNCVYVKAGTTYTISMNLNTPQATTPRDSVIVDGNNKELENLRLWANESTKTFTPTNSGFLVLAIDINTTNIMIEEGSTATTYEPYVEKSIKVDNEDFISMDNLVSVGVNQPGDGKRVWVKKSKNDFNKDGQLNTIATVVQGGATIVKTADKITFTTTSSNNSGFSINGANISKYIDNLDTSKNYYVSMDIKASRNINVQMGIVTRPNFAVTTETQRIQTTTTINGTAGFEVWSTSQTADDTIEVANIMISTSPEIAYEPYVEEGLYVDEVEWYSPKKIDDIETRIATRVSYLLSTTIGWKRIARMSGMSGGTMLLSNTASYGTLGEFNFTYAGGFGNTFTKIYKIITNGNYFNKARIVQKGNSEGYLELYQQFEYSRTLTLVLSPLSQGVDLYTQETEGSIPDGYTATEYTFT